MSFQTVRVLHCDADGCPSHGPFDTEAGENLPAGWVELRPTGPQGGVIRHLCPGCTAKPLVGVAGAGGGSVDAGPLIPFGATT